MASFFSAEGFLYWIYWDRVFELFCANHFQCELCTKLNIYGKATCYGDNFMVSFSINILVLFYTIVYCNNIFQKNYFIYYANNLHNKIFINSRIHGLIIITYSLIYIFFRCFCMNFHLIFAWIAILWIMLAKLFLHVFVVIFCRWF